ncbi:hypothetical protein J6590_032003 [Homalodisca vitripennis]|nr:hypothetical protein J6590_032003 [Homalodisca vitripennis]
MSAYVAELSCLSLLFQAGERFVMKSFLLIKAWKPTQTGLPVIHTVLKNLSALPGRHISSTSIGSFFFKKKKKKRSRSPFKSYSARPHGPLACAKILSNRIRGRVIQYKVDGTERSARVKDRIRTCAISDSDFPTS